MLVSDFNTNFEQYVNSQELEKANNSLLEELAGILVQNKSDFVDMLEESGIEADETMPKGQLIELFTENTDNKKMLLGASLLANSYNKNLSFDGDDEISDENVKLGYAILNENFNGDEYDEVEDEDFSYIAIGALAGLVKGGVNLWRNNRQRQGKSTQVQNKDFNRAIEMRREAARRRMEQAAIQRQRIALEQQRLAQEEAKKRRRRTTTYIIIGTVVMSAIIGTIVFLKNKK